MSEIPSRETQGEEPKPKKTLEDLTPEQENWLNSSVEELPPEVADARTRYVDVSDIVRNPEKRMLEAEQRLVEALQKHYPEEEWDQ